MPDVKHTAEQRKIGEAAMAARLAKGPASMSELAAVAADAIGGMERVQWACHRMADRWLQRMRKSGNATFTRGGGATLWRVQAAARAGADGRRNGAPDSSEERE